MARKLSRRVIAQYVAHELLQGANHAALVQQLAGYLVESRRTKELGLIVRDVQHTLAEKGNVVGTITSAHELSSKTHDAIVAYAKNVTGASSVELDTSIDESVLGGVRINLPGHEYDATIAHQLKLLRTRYKKA